ncbi:hypothetical protein GCM10017788_78060 [Amycolatopsis acidiphila]|nr:hypothetical protein GCM10017788_78060 [Amycolatopsis acidiphila]
MLDGRFAVVAPITSWLIEWRDLLAKLDRAVTRKVTIISTPAGNGKSSLLRAWADRAERRRIFVLQVRRDQQDA